MGVVTSLQRNTARPTDTLIAMLLVRMHIKKDRGDRACTKFSTRLVANAAALTLVSHGHKAIFKF